MKKVIAFGTFDLVHPGHVHMLKEAKSYGDYLVVIVARDETVLEVKKHLPLHTEGVRLEHITALGIADKVRLGNLGNKFAVIDEEKPDIVALGYDQKVPIDKLSAAIEDHVKIVRLSPFKPDIFKSSKLKKYEDSHRDNKSRKA
jgi:FAD synthetase